MTGKDLIVILSRNNSVVADTRIKSNDIKTSAGTLEVASATQQDWKEFLAGRAEWQLSINYLVLASAQLLNLLFVRQTFTITIRDAARTVGLTGEAIMTDCGNVAAIETLATGSFQLKGNGALSAIST